MEYVSLDKDPNQQFTLDVDNYVLKFTLRFFRNQTFCSIAESQRGVEICTSRLAADRRWLLPLAYERKFGVNLRFEDDNHDYPVYSNFNGSCVLCVYTTEEAEELRESGN